MCGIVGFIDKYKNKDTVLKDMLDIQSYRGSDDIGTYFDEKSGIHFGHNRLSIQDLSFHGHQPFVSDCENYVIVFNGEVYNFKSIKTELEKLGYVFISNSDTEVILYSYKEWGIKSIGKFIGMFAFSILDKLQNKLVLVRDRAGVKPLYYYTNQNQFMFSSELKSFHQHPKFQKIQNTDVLPYFFQFGYIPAPYTIFENCYKLAPGCYLEFNIKKFTYHIQKYWDVNDHFQQKKLIKSENEILDDIENLLDDAIDLRMVADVPIGVFLSGGYDSSLVAAILAKKQGKSINTFTIGFNSQKYNEAEHAKVIAEYLKTNHTEYYMTDKDLMELIPLLPFYYDEPFGDSSALPTMIVSKLARKQVTVVLSADGGDETFCGYSKYFFLHKFLPIYSNSVTKTLFNIGLTFLNENFIEKVNEALPKHLAQTNIKDKFIKFKRALDSTNFEEMFLNASSYSNKKDIEKWLKIHKKNNLFDKFERINSLEPLDQMMAIDYKTFLCDDVLTKVDRATMHVSLEGREPLLDHRIIEYMAKVPLKIKYKNSQPKYLLRKILYKYIPKELIDKPKSGFQIPLNEWLRHDLKSLVNQYINKDTLDKQIFNINQIETMKNDFFAGLEIGNTIWFILMYQMWKEKWLD